MELREQPELEVRLELVETEEIPLLQLGVLEVAQMVVLSVVGRVVVNI